MRERQPNGPLPYQPPEAFKAEWALWLRRIWKRIGLILAAVIAVPILFVVGYIIYYIIYLSCRHHTTVEEVKGWMATLPPKATQSDVSRLFISHGIDWTMSSGRMRRGVFGDADEGFMWKSDIWVDVTLDNNGRVESIDVLEHTLAP